MEDKRTFIKKELKPEEFVYADAVKAVRFWTVVHTESGGYTEGDMTLHLFPDGGITISENDGDGFISIQNPDSVKALKDLLNTKIP